MGTEDQTHEALLSQGHPPPGEATCGPEVEVAHEALIRNWPRLRG
jgi:hypothetical protein